MCTPMDKNKHNKKDFLDTLDSTSIIIARSPTSEISEGPTASAADETGIETWMP